MLNISPSTGLAQNEVQLNGIIRQYYVDAVDETNSRLKSVLEQENGKFVELSDSNNLLSRLSGHSVNIHGQRGSGNDIDTVTVTSVWPLQSVQPDLAAMNAGTLPASVTRTRTILVVAVNFNQVLSILSAEQISDMLSGPTPNLRDFFSTASFGQFALNVDKNQDGRPDVISVTIDQPLSCAPIAPFTWAIDVNNKLREMGINSNEYDHLMMVVPHLSILGCGWGGIAEPRGQYTWIAQAFLHTMAHELGHNLGLGHSGQDYNSDSIIDDQYGDSSCIMGADSHTLSVNGPHMQQLRWLMP